MTAGHGLRHRGRHRHGESGLDARPRSTSRRRASTDEPDNLQTAFDPTRVQINERSLRLQAGGLARYDRAEAFFRFPEGRRASCRTGSFACGRAAAATAGGRRGELQFFVKVGRDPNNFYHVSHAGRARVRRARRGSPRSGCGFEKFFALRAKLEGAYLRGSSDSLSCTGADSALIARSGLPTGAAVNRFAACDGGYMVYTTDPAVAPPNLGSVQEMAVGIVRVDSATGPTPLMPSDTLEVWVDDIRLADVVSETGFAGQIGIVDGVRRPGDVPPRRPRGAIRTSASWPRRRRSPPTTTWSSRRPFGSISSFRLDSASRCR